MTKALLVLKDGRTFEGRAFGAVGRAEGEIVFNTSMSGYQEILTDPSYEGQIVTMTCPLIGNVGVNGEDMESRAPFVRGFIIREESRVPSNWRKTKPLGEWLAEKKVVGIQSIDTRALTRHIRQHGAMPGIIDSTGAGVDELKKRAAALKGLDGVDCVRAVTCAKPYEWREGLWRLASGFAPGMEPARFHVAAYDYGIKTNILRNLASIGARVTVVPADTSARDVLALKPDGVFLSNGPGDPAAAPYAAAAVKQLLGKVPVFGICLGHQILCHAYGGKTYKLKFGHHGGNHPVMDLSTRKVEITAQNHNFAADPDSLPAEVEVTHINLNDNTVEGMRHTKLAAFSVQYHPEASPGPHDASYLFARFAELMTERKK
ncbi:MAG: glutamine-hydrolyzing carbamoyl-phosphate synthase small subunit [Nitrospinae bacterium]|nr:glutamine-hydrolyzing carbamoyl-phosphate synthase small subunit [Nitrospinota bacterium]